MSQGQAGRYQRSANGMVGAMVVLLLVVFVYVGFRALNRDNDAIPVPAVAYAVAVRQAVDDGKIEVLAPPSLPTGWKATSVDYVSVPRPAWHLGVLTADQQYIGVEQSLDSVADLVSTYVDPAATPHGTVDLDLGNGTTTWRVWTDDGGDTGLSARVGRTSVVVVGSASRAVIEDYVSSLEITSSSRLRAPSRNS